MHNEDLNLVIIYPKRAYSPCVLASIALYDPGFREADDIIISEVATVVGGSTGIVAMIRDTDVIVANLGDCRAVLSKRGKAIDISKDHKPDSESEQKRIEAAGGFVRAHRLMGILGVARAFGDNEYKCVVTLDH